MSGGGEPLDYVRIYNMLLPELREEVAALGIDTPNAPNRDQLIDAIAKYAAEKKAAILTTGILEILDDEEGGLIVYERDSYRVKALSAYVPQAFIKHYGLQRGHIVRAQLHPHREGESCPIVIRVESVMDQDPETLSEIVPFTERVPYYPTSRILMEADSEAKWDNLSMRVVDCLTPVGFGQRGLIVAPPRTGKTVLMQGMANSIQKNYPDSHLIILLIDERPEEVTDFRRQVSGEVISSTFDETAESHVHAAEMVIEKARRMVEVGKDVVILLDSITRLARAYNTTMPSSGKILSGGVEANALQKPKRFFGSARNIEDGGSLTIIATALVETGSKMDEVIFEEFKGTGNMELHLDRGLSDKRIFPALSMDKSGTRKEELLYHPDEMLKIYSLRRAMKGLPSTDAMEMLIQRIKKTNTNAEFLMSVAR
jgi:transcription termination factor Rho